MNNRINPYTPQDPHPSGSTTSLQDLNNSKQQSSRYNDPRFPREMMRSSKSENDFMNRDNRDRSSTMNSIDSLNINSIENSKMYKVHVDQDDMNELINESPANIKSPTWLLSDILQSFSSIRDTDEYQIVSKGNDLVSILIKYPHLKNDIVLKSFLNKIQFMLYHDVSEVRATGYRIMRYIISNYESLTMLIQSKILIFIIISLSTNSSLLEKEQALKLIREFLNIPKGTDNLSIGVIKSLIAIIEISEPVANITDNFKKICIETICEIALLRPELIFHSSGFKIIIETIVEDDSIELSGNCILVLMKVLDSENTRKFLRNGHDLNSLVSTFSSIDSGEEDKNIPTFKLQKAAFSLSIILKNWNGLMSFSHNNFACLKDLILNLKKKGPKLRDIIMDIILDMLRIEMLPWLKSSSIGDVIQCFNNYGHNSNYSFEYDEISPESFEFNLINHYLGLIIAILINHGIIDLLIEVIEENSNEANTKKATKLVTHIYSMANNFLPNELLQSKLILPSLRNECLEHSSTFKIWQSTRRSNEVTQASGFDPSNSSSKKLKLYIKNVSIGSRYNIDDTEFKNMVNNIRILTIKEYEDWNWNLLFSFIQGPLRNPKRFDEILEKNPKFLKRLMSFYRPFKFRFCNMPITHKNFKMYINIGCQLLETYLTLNQGIKYLSSNKLLPQVSEIFAQVDPYSGIVAKEPILSKKRLENTLSIGYVKFIGTLSANSYGLKMLEQWQFINLFHNIIEGSRNSESNNYLIINLLNSLDFTIDSQLRIVLSKAIGISNLKIRNFIIDNVIPKLIKIKECEHFVIKLLVNQLYDLDQEISDKSIDLLYDCYLSNDINILNHIISLRPSIVILSKHASGKMLLMNFMKTSIGFKFLEDSGFIDAEFDKWINLIGFEYVKKIELLIQRRFFPYVSSIAFDEKLPVHFFNYLLQTEEGLVYFQTLKQRNYLENLISNIEMISAKIAENNNDEISVDDGDEEEEDQSKLINKLKQNLWIIGSIASAKYGIQLLDTAYTNMDKSVVSMILNLFYNSPSWQIRGISFYLIGSIASTIEGIEILDELNWYSVIDKYHNPMKLSYPKDLYTKDIFNVEINNPYRDIKYYSLFSGGDENLETDRLFGDIDDDEFFDHEKIYEKILNLVKHSSSVLNRIARKATKQLMFIKKNSPSVFENRNLFLKIIKLVDRGSYKFSIRKFIFELFLDTKVLENLVKRDKKNINIK
ncbi:DEHA2A10230p [Debaryomyces hansenii CBS767]|uniref:DEHA2A10230p n=1 Tax=Debaryomyces hansenii (strain ATCC 36239 / CBS 767 / BCRC 21394 / JCM 1990 / NBRC 0083 / IGC 2968) TaxID=284592 RepID=Q6BYE3_DEBHA|nr:DEHA2A10230p [Debaryomyces hansenii CBS767]CAG84739.2 DEHA2A10230p [Debaryomyces hansenii CBS767]|eukprot:XP_456776.2 DEHA2A10230p [Debaryomyces hansenii CBS767]